MPDRSTAASEPLWRHGAFSPHGGLPVARPLYGFRPVSLTLRRSDRAVTTVAREQAPASRVSRAFGALIVRSGQETVRHFGYYEPAEIDASAFSRRRSRASLAQIGQRGARFFDGSLQENRGPRRASASARERSVAKSALAAGPRNAAISTALPRDTRARRCVPNSLCFSCSSRTKEGLKRHSARSPRALTFASMSSKNETSTSS